MFPRIWYFQYQQEFFTLFGNKCMTISENTILADINTLVAFYHWKPKEKFLKKCVVESFRVYTLEYEGIEI